MKFYVNKEYLATNIEYPRRFTSEKLMKISIIVLFSIFLFLLLFKPFGVYDPELRMHYLLICFFHSFAPAIVLYIYFMALNYFRRRKGVFHWTLLKEYAHIGIVLILMGLVSFLMRDMLYYNPDNWSWRYFFEEIRNCLVAGIFFYFFLRLSTFYIESKKGSPSVLEFIPITPFEEREINEPQISISTQVRQDDFQLDIEGLLFVKADGNYIELTLLKSEQIITEVKRISLTQFENQLSAYPNIFRCHRAFLVNMFKIEKVTGNSQGYLLSFRETDLKVPVSRRQTDSFNACYQALNNK
ncbi:LytTR family DNA-binding domain-containing protein [uncultured Chryseobacterium sp.]|uniref:LytTR family DNA-binding domain-containing protein n=1 Tax=uncultured Chryseobacterium sp. TaxID=259322 RepID=UPI002589DBFE|nr:LytTR family DNA-binding domain-containing protein [uncultured Chryseobacterium sp.]